MTSIVGYETSNATEVLANFIAAAKWRYKALEMTVTSVDERIADLQKDWCLRPITCWKEILIISIPAIREATTKCLDLFDKKWSQVAAIPIVMCATSISYECDLYRIGEKIEEVCISFTVHLHTSGESNSVEEQISERQHLLTALQQLSESVHKAVDNGYARLNEAPREQSNLLHHKTNNRRPKLHIGNL